MSELTLLEWLEERRENCLRIAKVKLEKDREGWLEDASYFARCKEAVRMLVEASGDEHANSPIRMWIALGFSRVGRYVGFRFTAELTDSTRTAIDAAIEMSR